MPLNTEHTDFILKTVFDVKLPDPSQDPDVYTEQGELNPTHLESYEEECTSMLLDWIRGCIIEHDNDIITISSINSRYHPTRSEYEEQSNEKIVYLSVDITVKKIFLYDRWESLDNITTEINSLEDQPSLESNFEIKNMDTNWKNNN